MSPEGARIIAQQMLENGHYLINSTNPNPEANPKTLSFRMNDLYRFMRVEFDYGFKIPANPPIEVQSWHTLVYRQKRGPHKESKYHAAKGYELARELESISNFAKMWLDQG
jgi:hypothetical protein